MKIKRIFIITLITTIFIFTFDFFGTFEFLENKTKKVDIFENFQDVMSFVDEKNASYNKAVDLFGENLIREEE